VHSIVDGFDLRLGDDFGPDLFLAHLFIGVFHVLMRGGMGPIGDVVNGVWPHAESAGDQFRRHAFEVKGVDGDSLRGREFAFARGCLEAGERVLVECDVHFVFVSVALT
jgi:hypothetical protein